MVGLAISILTVAADPVQPYERLHPLLHHDQLN